MALHRSLPLLVFLAASCMGTMADAFAERGEKRITLHLEDTRSAPAGTPLVLYAGGRRACHFQVEPSNSYMAPHAAALLERFGDAPLRTILACFGERGEALQFISSDAPGRVMRGDVPVFLAFARAALESDPTAEIAAAGHSWGAWLMMQTVLASPEDARWTHLVTLDPISPRTCSPSTYVWHFLSDIVRLRLNFEIPGCNSAPPDIPHAALRAIAARTERWENHFQQDFRVLHSSGIAEASSNKRWSYPEWNDHDQMPKEDEMVELVSRNMAAALGR